MKIKLYLLILVIVILFLVGCAGRNDALAQCLTDNDVVMYGAFWCSACAKQKSTIGKSFDQISYVECSTPDRKAQTSICISKDIKSYPTWEFANGKKITGVLSLAQLASISGCDQ